jgi:hypothetical protein
MLLIKRIAGMPINVQDGQLSLCLTPNEMYAAKSEPATHANPLVIIACISLSVIFAKYGRIMSGASLYINRLAELFIATYLTKEYTGDGIE